jgi:hypothetical protein
MTPLSSFARQQCTGHTRRVRVGTLLAFRRHMDENIDLEEVLRRALKRCDESPPCLGCLSEAAAELILECEFGPNWRSIMEAWPIEEPIAV